MEDPFMPNQDISAFYQWLQTRLSQKGYAPLPPASPLDVAFFKHGALNLPYVIAAVDTGHVSNTATEIFQRLEPWFRQLIGRTGAGVLLVIHPTTPPITTVEEIQKLGNSQLIAGVHDLHSGKHWLSNILNWEQEIYGD
jgi:hypothetical protein